MADGDNDFDVFEDPNASSANEPEFKEEPEIEANPAADEQSESEEADEEGSEEKDGEESGEEDSTPPVDKEDNKDDDQANKMVPEKRLKAVVSAMSAELAEAKAELAKYQTTPVPDKEKDPEGHAAHLRMDISKKVMYASHPDYLDVIAHYQKMADENPSLNDLVMANELPAKFAYDLAKEDMAIRELRATKDSPEWKEFQAWKKEQKTAEKSGEEKKPVKATSKADVLSKVPNLNRATNISQAKAVKTDDDLFVGSPF